MNVIVNYKSLGHVVSFFHIVVRSYYSTTEISIISSITFEQPFAVVVRSARYLAISIPKLVLTFLDFRIKIANLI